MLRFLYSTDWHAKAKSPSTRIDDFASTIEKKIRYFFQLGHELGVDAFLGGGDFIDTPYISEKYVIHIGEVIKEEIKDKKMYFVWGNHDMIAYNPNSMSSTNFGIFEHFFDRMVLLNKPKRFIINNQPIMLSGVSSYAYLDKHIYEGEQMIAHRSRDYVIEEDYGIPLIHIVHGYLSPKPILEDIPHVVIDEMKHTKATITLTGHEHTGFPVTKIDHGLVYNPGALGRVFASHSEMKRMPKYALITIHDNGTPEIQPIECPIAEVGEKVMDRTALDEKKAKEAFLLQAQGNIQEILRDINIGAVDLHLILGRYKEKVRPDIYSEAKKRLGL